MDRYQKGAKELKALGKYILERGMNWGNAGNISLKTSDNTFLITASGTHLGELRDDDFVEFTLEGERIKGNKKPSKELNMHQNVYLERPDVGAVIHASPYYSTLLSAARLEIPNNWFVEGMYYLERVERVEYYHPGSPELARAVRKKATSTNIILLENHGVLVYDKSVKEAKAALTTLEVACRMLINARAASLEINGLSRETVRDFLENSGYRPRRKWEK